MFDPANKNGSHEQIIGCRLLARDRHETFECVKIKNTFLIWNVFFRKLLCYIIKTKILCAFLISVTRICDLTEHKAYCATFIYYIYLYNNAFLFISFNRA